MKSKQVCSGSNLIILYNSLPVVVLVESLLLLLEAQLVVVESLLRLIASVVMNSGW